MRVSFVSNGLTKLHFINDQPNVSKTNRTACSRCLDRQNTQQNTLTAQPNHIRNKGMVAHIIAMELLSKRRRKTTLQNFCCQSHHIN